MTNNQSSYLSRPHLKDVELPEPGHRVECGVNGRLLTIDGNSLNSWTVLEGRRIVLNLGKQGDVYVDYERRTRRNAI